MTRRFTHCWEAALEGDRSPAVMAHLRACPACARKVEEVRRAADGARADIPPPPAGLDSRVLSAVAREQSTRASARRGRSRLALRRPLSAAVGVVAAIALLAFALRPVVVSDDAQAVSIVPLTAACPPAGSIGENRIEVAGVWAGEEAKRFADVLERFEQRSGVKVTFLYETRNTAALIEARVKRGCPPDVALLPQPGLMASLARRGQIQPLDDVAGGLVRDNYSATWRELSEVDGRLYGVWFKAADKSTVWYSAAAFRAAGVSRPPETWPELLQAAHRLRTAGFTPLAIAGADGWTLTDWFENVYLRDAGPVLYAKLAAHEIPWTHPSVARALRQLAAIFGDEALVGPSAAVGAATFEDSVAAVFGRRPRAAMVYEGDFVRNFVPRPPTHAAARRAGAGDARFFDFPSASAGTAGLSRSAVVGGDVAVLFKGGGAGKQLIRFLATPEAAAVWARQGGFLSPNRRLARSAYADALGRRAAEQLAAATTVRFDLSDLQPPAFGATVEQGEWEIFQDFARDSLDVASTMRRLEAGATAARACERAIGGHC